LTSAPANEMQENNIKNIIPKVKNYFVEVFHAKTSQEVKDKNLRFLDIPEIPVDEGVVDLVKKHTEKDISNYVHSFDFVDSRHTLKHLKEMMSGGDVNEKISNMTNTMVDTIANFDFVMFVKKTKNAFTLRYYKTIDGKSYKYVEIILNTENKRLAEKTFFEIEEGALPALDMLLHPIYIRPRPQEPSRAGENPATEYKKNNSPVNNSNIDDTINKIGDSHFLKSPHSLAPIAKTSNDAQTTEYKKNNNSVKDDDTFYSKNNDENKTNKLNENKINEGAQISEEQDKKEKIQKVFKANQGVVEKLKGMCCKGFLQGN
jgi:hypothetical protein